MTQLDKILVALEGAMVGEGDDLVVDLGALEDGLAAAGVNCTATTNRGALANELGFLRDEMRILRTRLGHISPEQIDERLAAAMQLNAMEVREAEIGRLLWLGK